MCLNTSLILNYSARLIFYMLSKQSHSPLLMDRFGEKLNWKLIGEYFKLFKKEEMYEKFKKEYSKAK